jgi:MoxR-like ATPase
VSKLAKIAEALNERFQERSDLIDGMMTALLAREMLFMLGTPGTAKSDVCNALCGAIGGKYFSWLMGKFTTPEELFGPLSLSALEKDSYRRVTTNKLPEADIGFLDEVFKGSSAILNTLLPVLNERTFYNDGTPTTIPLQTVFGASNEIPQAEELAALYDRFSLRFVVNRMASDSSASSLFTRIANGGAATPIPTITKAELAAEQLAATKVTVPANVIDIIVTMRKEIEDEGIYVSDRRWVQSLRIVKAYAHYQGATQVEPDHLEILKNVLWATTDQVKLVARMVNKHTNPLGEKITELVDAINSTIDAHNADDKTTPGAEVVKKVKGAIKQLKSLGDVNTNKRLASEVKKVSKLYADFCKNMLGEDFNV